ncbi:hypothetical protein N8D56_04495 [Devosia sp. A8/3-2]|nr:hypothetical protein N8D56_04495 [Devosia sp. A8/3-2]
MHHWAEWPGAENPGAVEALEALVRKNSLENYLLIPAADADVKLVAREHERLSAMLQVMLPGWDQLQWACDKALTYQRAAEVGIAVPRVYVVGDDLAATAASIQFPVVLKPTMRIALNRFTRAKAWRADNAAEFIDLFTRAAQLQQGKEHIVVQEYIPGGGETQFSYAGVWWNGTARASFAAQRTRQFPVEFSYTSTFVRNGRPARCRGKRRGVPRLDRPSWPVRNRVQTRPAHRRAQTARRQSAAMVVVRLGPGGGHGFWRHADRAQRRRNSHFAPGPPGCRLDVHAARRRRRPAIAGHGQAALG